ncbi:hypothetical protein AEAC466_17355 [Asticcacaulis sp. AC466]|uniref:head-tail joining protein n=1 Tax=Asticcacaulis sp. AC466 TaxID=1282362 RepID=UPI0003C40A82|nr:hypothetical protein [Asticcacaulis sp. AC466]ESQ82390.1 hypothetical protein AEAC466_17355 [Asticcacaulis sp. AC466]
MSFRPINARIDDTVFGRFGDDALWGSAVTPAKVLIEGADAVETVGRTPVVMPTHLIEVRVSDVHAPEKGDAVVITTDAGPETYKILSQPLRNSTRTRWICEAQLVSG